MMGTLRFRLLLGTSTATTLILGLLGTALYVSLRHLLLADFDAVTLAKANMLASMCEQRGQKVRFDCEQQPSEFSRTARPEYFEIRLNGNDLARSVSLGSSRLPITAASGLVASEDSTLPDGRNGRTLSLRFKAQLDDEGEHADKVTSVSQQGLVLGLSRETRGLDSTLAHVRELMYLLFGVAVLASGLMLLVVVAQAMQPVHRLAQEIESFPETDLSNRLKQDHVPLELVPVVHRLNGLLKRLEGAFVRERAFTADVAHELRTPLSGLLVTLQVCRSRPRELSVYQATLDQCLKMTHGIISLVQTLLLLTRADAGQLAVAHEPVDLTKLIQDCWGGFVDRARERGLEVHIDLPDGCGVLTDADQLKMILNNLLDNAVSYADPGGTIRLEAFQSADMTTVRIDNTFAELEKLDMSRLFQRFWRGDVARSETGLHCGLGLSLCARLVGLIGGKISAELNAGIFSICVQFPSIVSPDASDVSMQLVEQNA